jgi:uncharacterized protein (DUF488 family)
MIYTIGHSNHTAERFVELLQNAKVQCLVDVRSRPYSKYVPHARKRELEALLRSAGIEYVFSGDHLGGMPDDPSLYRSDSADYEAMSALPAFQRAIAELAESLADGRQRALMCAEENPHSCHRRRLLTPALEARGVRVRHLRGDGTEVSDSELDRGQQLPLW